MSRPTVVTICMLGSYESWLHQQQRYSWHSRAGGGAVHSIKSGHASQFTRWALADCIPDCKKSPRDTWAFKNAEIEFGSAYDSWLNVLLAPDLKGSAVA